MDTLEISINRGYHFECGHRASLKYERVVLKMKYLPLQIHTSFHVVTL